MDLKPVFLFCIIFCLLSNPVTANGFTVKSLSSSHLISNNETLAKTNFTIDLVLNEGGQYIEGYIEPSDFDISGVKVKSTIKLEVSKITESLSYAILNQGTLWRYDIKYYDASGFYEGAKCEPAPAYCFVVDVPGRIGFGYDRVININRIPAGSYGGLQNPDLVWAGTITLTIDGKPYKQKIGSGESARGSVHFPIGNVQWVGSLVTGQAVPNQNLYTASHRLETSRWSLAPKTEYEKYIKSLTEADTILQVWNEQQKKYSAWDKETYEELVCTDVVCSALVNILTIHNANVETLLNKNVQIDYGSVTAKSSISGYDGNIYDVIDRRISNPELVINLKASSLNVIILTGKPQIEDIIVPSFAAGDNDGYAKVLVRNIGDTPGTFATRTSGSFESNKITLASGETGTLVLILKDGMNASNIRKENVEVYDIASGSSDTKEFTVTQTAPLTFLRNDTRVYNDVVTKSDSTGQVEFKELDCSTGIFHFSNGRYQCTSIEDSKIIVQPQETQKAQVPLILEPPPEKGFDYLWFVVLLFVIILAAMLINFVAGFFSMRIPSRKKGITPGIFVLLGFVVLLVLFVLYLPEIKEIGNEMIIKYVMENIIK